MHADDAVLEPVDDQDVPDAPAEEQHAEQRDEVRDDQRDDRADRGAEAVPGEDPVHARMLAVRGAQPEQVAGGHASPGVRSVLGSGDLQGLLVGAPHDHQVVRGLERARARPGDRPRRRSARPPADTIRSPTSTPGRGRGAAVLDATDQDPVTLRQPDRAAQSACDVVRRDRDTEPRSLDRLALARAPRRGPGAPASAGSAR